MNDLIKSKLQLLTEQPGCYLMKNELQEIIYVGKAKRLNHRVPQYFNKPHEGKTQKLVSEIVDFETIVTSSEKEALLLEINLIQQYYPRYNILLKDNRSYPYIQVTLDDHPYLKIARNAKNRRAKYFGPFPNSSAAYEVLTLLNRLFPLRKCTTLPGKACLYYHLKQCLAPCIVDVSPSTYKDIIDQITEFMKGNTSEIRQRIVQTMELYAERLEYEQANEQKKLIDSIDHVISQQKIQFSDRIDRDAFGYHVRNGYISIATLMYRNGVLSAKDVSVFPLYEDDQEAFTQYLLQFYQNHTRPKEVILPDIVDSEVLEEALDVTIITPSRGAKSDLISMVAQNAVAGMNEQFAITNTQSLDKIDLLESLGGLLGIHAPMVIDVIDNSHMGGADSVSAVIVFRNGDPDKSAYRKYRHEQTGDDLAMMKETIYRRYYRKIIEKEEFPNLLIVDGGINQVLTAKKVIQELELLITVCGLAKDDKHRTRALILDDGTEIALKDQKSLFFFLTRMQDEVHRYVITFHRNVRTKSMTSSVLDSIPGVGPKRKQRLMEIFGNIKKIQEASLSELSQYVPLEIAQIILEKLKKMDQDENRS